jgi:outer membrane lipoprotein SlyB
MSNARCLTSAKNALPRWQVAHPANYPDAVASNKDIAKWRCPFHGPYIDAGRMSGNQIYRSFTMTKTFPRSLAVATSSVVLAGLVACAAPAPIQPAPVAVAPQPGYSSQAPQGFVEFGRVSKVEVLQAQGQQQRGSGLGAVIGGIAGAVVGSQIGGGFGRDVATVGGAVGGAFAGNAIEKNRNAGVRDSYRISIQMENGVARAYDVPSPGELRAGDRVRVENGQITRL